MNDTIRQPDRRQDFFLPVALALAALFAYLALHGLYRPENMDDAWFLSFAHNHIVNGVEQDTAFGTAPGGDGFGGVLLFGKTFSTLYGTLLNAVGWTKSHAHAISLLCMILAAACWTAILRRAGFSRRLALVFAPALLLVEPSFGAANQARPDALSFFLVSATLLLFLRQRHAWAGFCAAMALEIHPAGFVAALLVMGAAALTLPADKGLKKTAPLTAAAGLALGLGLGLLYYLALHGRHLGLLADALSKGNAGESGNILVDYFFKTKYYRHIPELLAFLACAGWFAFKRHDRENRFIPALLAAGLLFTLLVRRPNFMYAVYLYPAFLLLLLWTFERHGRLALACCLLLLYLLPQYAFVYIQNRDWNMDAYLSRVRALAPRDGTPVVGRPNDWFAFPDRPFYADEYRGDFRSVAPEKLVQVEGDAFRAGAHPALKSVLEELYEPTECGQFQSRGETVRVKAWNKKSAAPSAPHR